MTIARVILVAVLSAAAVLGAPIQTCQQQTDCFAMTFEQLTLSSTSSPCVSSTTSAARCQFRACLKLNLGGACVKGTAGDTVSHTCAKDENTCGGGDWSGATKVDGLADGFQQCQTGLAGGTLTFILKDGSGCSGSANLGAGTNGLLTGSSMTCAPSQSLTCSGQGNIGKECLWTVRLPNCTSSTDPLPKSGDCSNCPAATAECNALEASLPANYLHADLPNCNARSTAAALADYGCRQVSDSCSTSLVCDKFIPSDVLANLGVC